jgi:hypothetical protein
VLSLLRCFKEKKLRKPHFEDAVVAIEKFHFLFTAVTSQRSSGGISEMYASLGRRLFEARDTQSAVPIIKEIKKKLRERIPVFDEFRALFPTIIYTDNQTKQKRLVQYVLACHQRHTLKSVIIDFDAMTIEHLVSQKLIGTAGFSDEVVGQLGNLILVTPALNTQLDDKPFKEKKKILRLAGVAIPPELANLDELKPADIQRRTTALADQAYNQVWKI